jgi:CubicO group peptidase (beta-lactamase class C family)
LYWIERTPILQLTAHKSKNCLRSVLRTYTFCRALSEIESPYIWRQPLVLPGSTQNDPSMASSPLKALEAHLSTIIPTSSNPAPTNGIPGAVILAATRSSSVYTHSTGSSSLDPALARPLTPASIFWIASCTKLLTSLAALQLVHRGLWTLSRPISDLIPELRQCKVLTGWSADGSPIFDESDAADLITLPHLLTHTSGLAYDFLSPDILKYTAWKASQKKAEPVQPPVGGGAGKRGGILETYLTPLLSRPGTTWMYGPSIDFAGLLVERLTGMRLGEYIQENVLGPLGVAKGEVVWRVSDLKVEEGWTEERKKERYVYLSMRNPDGKGGMVPVPGGIGNGPTDEVVDDLGGGGIRASPRAYVKVLESLVKEDGKILSPETLKEWAFSPWLMEGRLGGHLGRELSRVFGTLDGGAMLTGGLPLPTKGTGNWDGGEWEYNHSLVGCLARKRGSHSWSLHWGGLPNLFWFVDPKEEVAALLAMQLLPPADPVCIDVAVRFREAVTTELGRAKARM